MSGGAPNASGGQSAAAATSAGSDGLTGGTVSSSGGANTMGGAAGGVGSTAGGSAGELGNSGSPSSGGSNTGGSAPSAGTSPGGSAGSSVGGSSAANDGAGGSGGGASGCGASGFSVKDGVLYDVNCEEFVIRGVNYPYTWYATRNVADDLRAIAATGANTVRLVLSSGGRWTKTSASELKSLIDAAKAAKLVSVVEVHDTTGYKEQSGSVELSNATSYWTSADIAAALKGQEGYVILNIANEPNGNDTSSSWAPSHVSAVQALRSAGLNHTLMIDAPNWGQDWENTMRDGGGAAIWSADSEKNLVFSVHMYDVYGTANVVTSYFNTFLMKYEAPLVVGEFAADHGASGNVDEGTIMSLAEMLGVGYMGWSWAGNSSDLSSLDITDNFNAASLTTWGDRLINGENGIKSTSQLCTCFP